MQNLSFPFRLTLTVFFLTLGCSLFAQAQHVVQLQGAKMRAALSLPKGTSTVQLCGLEPGNSYQVFAVPMAYGQRADFALAPATALTKGASNFAFSRIDKNAILFAAPTSCVTLQVQTNSSEQSLEVPMYLSVRCESCPESNAWLNKITSQTEQAAVTVQGGQTAEELVKNVLVGGDCFQVSNVTYQGVPSQIGTFNNGQGSIGFNSGVIMATGNIIVAPGPNNSGSASAGFGIATPDSDLSSLTAGAIFDRASIEFDFTPTESQVVFEYVFASEEYCEYIGQGFNDVFGFFISGPGITGTKNLALLPNSTTPITINNVNHQTNSQYYVHNIPTLNFDCLFVPPATGAAPLELQYDGFTRKMVAIANLIPCETYRIKLKVADVLDGVWDSAVFLRANSFNAGGTVSAAAGYPAGLASGYENCTPGHIRFTRSNSDTTLPLEINFTVAGTATPGVDYEPISSPVVIPAGQMELLVPVQVIPDQIQEGPESIVLMIDNSCSCSQGMLEYVINDRPELVVGLDNQVLCAGDVATLSPNVQGGIGAYSYLWNTGENTASISPTSTGQYSVAVADGCGTTSVSAALTFDNCGCGAETFFKTLEQSGENLRGFGVYDSGDGNLYITGLKQDSALIVKMTPAGSIIWMRTFDVRPDRDDRISELIVDSEGMVVGCGQSGLNEPNVTGFVFRYNPATNNMQWVNTFGVEFPKVYGLMELPNGNYLVYDHPNAATKDLRIMEITRVDGILNPGSPLNKKLRLGNLTLWNSATIFNGKLYGVGQYVNGTTDDKTRHGLTRIDLNTGNVDWVRISHVDPGLAANLQGVDLLVEDDHIISVGYGNETGASLIFSQIFLQKNGLNGNLVWTKRFQLPAAIDVSVEELVSVPDGFVLYARGISPQGGNDLFLLKTNKDGDFQWAKKIDSGQNDLMDRPSRVQSQILVKNDHLFFVASAETPGADHAVVVKTTLAGTLDGDCDFISAAEMEFSSVLNPLNLAVSLISNPVDEAFETIARTPIATNLIVNNLCGLLIEDQLDISLCPGSSVVIGGVSYDQDTVFILEIPGNGGCDTLRTYTIVSVPNPTRTEDISFCPGGSVSIGGQVYDQSGIVFDTLTGTNGACDTIVTYTLTLLPNQTRTENISFCPGGSVSIGGQVYDQSGTVIDTIPGLGTDCDTIVTYQLTLLPQISTTETISLCPGESVTLGGVAYNQPGTVVLTLPASHAGECDTIRTYHLEFATPAPSNVSIVCPNAISVGLPNGTNGAVVNFNDPSATSDCPCPGIALTQTSGLPAGSTFPMGVTNVCFSAQDSCGQTASCCFNVTVEEDNPCDVKVNGCVKYELLTITEDAGKNRTYRIRVTNNCSNKLIYSAIQVPSGLVAMEPANFSTYTAPSGNTYIVRSPNFTPQYSIRFSSIGDGIRNGESDIFRYTLPAQADVLFIHVVSRLDPYVYVGAHLNTFYCPIGVTLSENRPAEERDDPGPDAALLNPATPQLLLFPNPTSGDLFADLSPWNGEQLNVRVLDNRGQQVLHRTFTAHEQAQHFDLPATLPAGLYILEVLTENGARHTGRFAVQR